MSNLLSSERCKISFNFEGLGDLDFIGVSRAASGTAIAVPQLKVQLDAGNNVLNFHPDSVFVTHCHADHSFRLTHFVSRSKPPLFFMPQSMVALAESFLLASQSLSNGSPLCFEHYEVNHISRGVVGGEDLENVCKNRKVRVLTVDCFHAATPSVGYAFYLEHKVLLPNLKGLSKHEIGQLAKSGEAVTETIQKPLFMFLGDTTPQVFESTSTQSFLSNGCKVVFVECSFIEDEDYENATRTGHTHWRDLKPYIEKYPSVIFVLMHFSRRYTKDVVDDFFAKEDHPNIRLFIAPDDVKDLSIYEVANE